MHVLKPPRLPRPGTATASLTAIGLLAILAAGGLPASGRHAGPPVTGLLQRLEPGRGGSRTALETEHFSIEYDPGVLSAARAEEAGRLAERGWNRCLSLFGPAVSGKIRLDLTPRFLGATGFARMEGRNGRSRPMIGVRYADLDYLGLSGEYVLTHEIAHVFSGALAGTSLGEGIADWAAGSFAGVPLQPWWGRALREGGLWIEPDALFVTGDFPTSQELNAVIRTAHYAESALLVQYLVRRFGWERTREFAAEYGRERGALNSNEERAGIPARLRTRLPPGQKAPWRPPDAGAIRALFARHFQVGWPDLRASWEQSMESDPVPAALAERVSMAHRIYGSIRNYEMWLLEQAPEPSREIQSLIRESFTSANRALQQGSVDGAARALARARMLLDRLRRPVTEARLGRLEPCETV